MNKFLWGLAVTVLFSTWVFAAETQQKDRARLDQIEQSLKSDVPRVLCLDSNFATGGQPTEQAFAKVAASGFHSVLSLRAVGEGIDLTKERSLVEKMGSATSIFQWYPARPAPNRRTISFDWSKKNPTTRCSLTALPPIGSAPS
jgi:hypothetical protein